MERSADSVLELTKSCVLRFEQLLKSKKRTELVESRLADFNLWADGVGALAKPGASLDSRLRGRASDLALVKNILFMLADSLDYYASLAETDTKYDGSIQNLDSAIKNLALIGTAIRRTGRASRNRRADQTFNPDEFPELRAHLECVVLLRPGHNGLFHKTDNGSYTTDINPSKLSSLQKRLIEANLRRRHTFLVAQKRSRTQKNVQTLPVPKPADSPLKQPLPTAVNSQDPRPAIPKGKEPTPHIPHIPHRPHTISGFSRASTAEGPLQYSLSAGINTPEPAKTQITFIASDSEFPRAPPRPLNRAIAKCPCCCQSLPVEILSNPLLWK